MSCHNRPRYFFVRDPCAAVVFGLSSARNKTMDTMLTTINTPMFAETAKAVSAPCWHTPVIDRSRLGYVVPLAERCAR
jgi:hypothetical protein